MKEKIMTLHPEGKQGVNISKRKYELVKEFIIATLSKNESITFKQLTVLANQELNEAFDGKVTWYLVTVKLDLEARAIIERIPNSSPQELRLLKK
ncbi:hypothetical protein GCM10027429_29490 [Marivirga atlantica]|jgi:hypothetical protein|uniref:Uncharacterized protein n=1 Tax=Marivirga atlantica TaxID=1548457 RepID=A0A937AN17_9BACT|nr:hypothetical protein [Marivirga atlantica]MBL0766528.1 hypothetical protein [Marivirga atlantica]